MQFFLDFEKPLVELEQKIKELRSQNKRIFQHSQEQKKNLEKLQNESWWKRLFG